jgi:hypothetical protein
MIRLSGFGGILYFRIESLNAAVADIFGNGS